MTSEGSSPRTEPGARLALAVSGSRAVHYVAAYARTYALGLISENVRSVTGYEAAAFTDDPDFHRSLVHPQDLRGFDALHAEIAPPEGRAAHYRIRTRAGRWIWIREECRTTRDPSTGEDLLTGCLTPVADEDSTRARLRELEGERDKLARLLADAVENIPGGFSVADPDDRLIVCNRDFARRYGCEPEDLVGTTLADYIGRLLPFVRRFDGVEMSASARDLARIIERLGRADGESVEVELDDDTWLLITRQRAPDGNIVTVRTDITRQKRTEVDLRESAERLQAVLENSPVCIDEVDLDGRIVSMNPSGLAMAQLRSEQEIKGRHFTELAHPSERVRLNDLFARVLDGERVEFEFGDGAGRSRRYYSAKIPMRGADGAVSRIIGMTVDITERARAEAAVRESEALIRRVLEASPVPIGMTRIDDSAIIYESPASQELFGRAPEAATVRARDFFVNPADRERYVRELQHAGRVDDFEVQLRKSSGQRFWAALSARLIEYGGEKVIVSSVRDLTESLAVQAEMARSRELVQKSERLSAMGELLASVSHELNNPLSVVVGQSLLLRETASDPAITARAERIGNAADRCGRIVNTFLAMARQRPRESRPVDVSEVIEVALDVTRYSLRAADIDLSTTIDERLPRVLADGDQLVQVLSNLLVNAEHALLEVAPPRRLEISASARGTRVELEVRDNGPGVPEDARSRIFDPFYTSKEVGEGTGMGLALCHRVVEAHGGTIELAPDRGDGTCFRVSLPALREDDVGPGVPSAADQRVARLTILVVDDEPEVAEVVADILDGDGHAVSVANAGEDALVLVGERVFDLVISDLRMPGIDGPALYERLVRLRPEMRERVAFLTGDTMSERVRRFLVESGRPCLEKPITPDEVRRFVRELARGLEEPAS